MKFIFSIAMAVLFAFTINSVMASEPVTYTCKDLYKRAIAKKMKSRENFNEYFDNAMLVGGSGYVVGTLAGGIVGMSIAAGWLAANGIIEGILALPSKSERAMKLENLTSRQFKKLLKEAREISAQTDESSLAAVIESGFNSGDFCSNNDLMSRKEMKRYILSHVKNAQR